MYVQYVGVYAIHEILPYRPRCPAPKAHLAAWCFWLWIKDSNITAIALSMSRLLTSFQWKSSRPWTYIQNHTEDTSTSACEKRDLLSSLWLIQQWQNPPQKKYHQVHPTHFLFATWKSYEAFLSGHSSANPIFSSLSFKLHLLPIGVSFVKFYTGFENVPPKSDTPLKYS